eukprot:COSAG03_NODE_3575_length_1942_cov_1.728703_2_plen_146_part_00
MRESTKLLQMMRPADVHDRADGAAPGLTLPNAVAVDAPSHFATSQTAPIQLAAAVEAREVYDTQDVVTDADDLELIHVQASTATAVVGQSERLQSSSQPERATDEAAELEHGPVCPNHIEDIDRLLTKPGLSVSLCRCLSLSLCL